MGPFPTGNARACALRTQRRDSSFLPGFTVAYTGDTGPDPALANLGRDADLYVVEATSRNQQPGTPPSSTAQQPL